LIHTTAAFKKTWATHQRNDRKMRQIDTSEMSQAKLDAPSPGGSQSPSPCALQCMSQQQALADCVNQIRDDSDNEKTKACLKPAANGWMTCCTEANAFARVDSTRPA
jgi:hypothetical protein